MDQFVISPEPFVQKCRSLARAKSIYLEVLEGHVRLAWKGSIDNDQGFMERVDAIGLGINYDMLLNALSKAGGAPSMSGRYPINDAIRRKLKRLLKAK